jgi:hypothetical protein
MTNNDVVWVVLFADSCRVTRINTFPVVPMAPHPVSACL